MTEAQWLLTQRLQLIAVIAISSVALVSCSSAVDFTSRQKTVANVNPSVESTVPSIADVLNTDPKFSILAAAVESAGLLPVLHENEPITLFAPTNDAFLSLPEETLESLLRPEHRDELAALLRHHIVSGRISINEITPLQVAGAINGQWVEVKASTKSVSIEGAPSSKILKTNLAIRNGVVYTIDRVLLSQE